MKRRNADIGKLRRPIKRNKITESFYGSTFVYVKFLMVWAAVLMADFILEFRFEYLWPFWLLIRSVYDSFKYQGLAFSVFFVCIAVTSDVVCYLFIPVQWLFFAASTYVWVQYVWHTDRGICLPTVLLWLLFVYIEASIRLREFKNFPFNLDLCRPFAAHCIGYPVVTLGFGFKSYVSYRFRLRKQKEVQKDNEFYYQLLQQALPIEQQNLEKQKALATSGTKEDSISQTAAGAVQQNGTVPSSTTSSTTTHSSSQPDHPPGSTSDSNHHPPHTQQQQTHKKSSSHSSSSHSHSSSKNNRDNVSSETPPSSNSSGGGGSSKKDLKQHSKQDKQNNASQHHHHSNHNHNSSHNTSSHIDEIEYIENHLPPSSQKRSNVNDFRGDGGDSHHHHNTTAVENERNERQSSHTHTTASTTKVLHKQQNGVGKHGGKINTSAKENNTSSSTSSGKKGKNNNTGSSQNPQHYSNNKDELISRLESDVRRHKQDLQGSRSSEQELRYQINNLLTCERQTKEEVAKLREDNENLQNKLHKLVTGRQQDKETVSTLEKQLADERKHKVQYEQQLSAEKKAKKEREAVAATALANATRNECSDKCKLRMRELETDMKQATRETQLREEQIQQLDRENAMLRKYKDAQSDNDLLMSALSAMQEKNSHLEHSLSAENRLKQDLFSALGDAKRQIKIQQGILAQKEQMIANLKGKVAEVMALIPAAAPGFGHVVINGPHLSDQTLAAFGSFAAASQQQANNNNPGAHTPPHSSHSSLEAAFTPPPQLLHTPPPHMQPPPQLQSQLSSGGGVAVATEACEENSDGLAASSSLNPMANDYTPKLSQ